MSHAWIGILHAQEHRCASSGDRYGNSRGHAAHRQEQDFAHEMRRQFVALLDLRLDLKERQVTFSINIDHPRDHAKPAV